VPTPLYLDLAALRPHELRRALPPAEYLAARPVLAAARLLRRPVLAPDPFPEALELRMAVESDWDALGASIEHAAQTRTVRDRLGEMGFRQVGAYRIEGVSFPRNFFAYVKEPDVVGAVYLADAAGPAPYLELVTRFREPRGGRRAVLTTSGPEDALDPSETLVLQRLAGTSPEGLFQLHRGKVNELGGPNRRAATVEDFTATYLETWNENYAAWRARGALKPAGGGR
jgi:hypothetical protein